MSFSVFIFFNTIELELVQIQGANQNVPPLLGNRLYIDNFFYEMTPLYEYLYRQQFHKSSRFGRNLES